MWLFYTGGIKEMANKGRPLGHKLSTETKTKISESKFGQKHTQKAKNKIKKSVIKYFKSPKGVLQREKMSIAYGGFWNSDEGMEIKALLGEGLRKHYNNYSL